jgi:SAM-dependent methyltransferase
VQVESVLQTLRQIGEFACKGDSERFKLGMWNSAEAIRSYLLSFQLEGTGEDYAPPYVNDSLPRFFRTMELVPLPPPRRILEIGSGPYYFHILLHKFFVGSEIEGTNFFDPNVFSTAQSTLVQTTESKIFREKYEFRSRLFSLETIIEYPYPPDTFDLIFFCETFEHLAIAPLEVFPRIRRILKPGGHLIVTLPNAVRLANFALMLDGYNFFDIFKELGIGGRHNREYTLDEMRAILEKHAFAVVRAETNDRYNYDTDTISTSDYTGRTVPLKRHRQDLMEGLKQLGGRLDDRGDNIYVLARKPVEPARG